MVGLTQKTEKGSAGQLDWETERAGLERQLCLGDTWCEAQKEETPDLLGSSWGSLSKSPSPSNTLPKSLFQKLHIVGSLGTRNFPSTAADMQLLGWVSMKLQV